MSEVKVTNENFEKEVINSNEKVIVDFFATWCGPCQMLAPVLSEIAEEYKDKIKVCKINVDEEQELAEKFEVVSIPTLVIFENGQPVKKSVGYISKSELEKLFL
ncbi:MAG: thioredoxin [Clostridiales bacterium]|nr:thioredoxin [Clostridiales bacterium]